MTQKPWVKWVQSLQKGDSRAASALYDETIDSVFRYCVTLTGGNQERAEEIAQEAYLKAFRSIAQLKEPEKFKNWLILIVRNLWLNEKRTSEHQVQRDSVSERVENEDQVRSLFDRVASRTETDPAEALTVKQILERLPQEHREIIYLADVEGLSHQEVAKQLGITEKNSRIRLFRARKKFLEIYERETKRA